ncbi:NAD(P)-binding protein [Rhizodiscina lignyota]|uniref:NAD(P)-binding protein n=1 Tax=Rhizodiscina lignyota TaxID=1504668 RepID=A0A9P4IMR1_9PEZI|nr:NAD(P)-binding protein [Rhizodiscina lignyota]
MTDVTVNEAQIGNIRGKVAVVTGGASGIGKAIIERLLKCEAKVVFCDLDESAGRSVEQSLSGHIKFMQCNVLVWKELRNVFAQAKRQFGSVDIVFANAGILESTSLFDDKLDDSGELAEPNLLTIDVNLKAVLSTARLAMYYFKQNSPPGGSLVISASSSSYNERPQAPLYSTAKHGLLGLLRAMRVDAPKMDVSVSAIAPGATAMVSSGIKEAMEANGITVQTPEYVALAATMLASDKKWNGKVLALLDFGATEVEDAIQQTMPQWYGKRNVDAAAKAASINLDRFVTK